MSGPAPLSRRVWRDLCDHERGAVEATCKRLGLSKRRAEDAAVSHIEGMGRAVYHLVAMGVIRWVDDERPRHPDGCICERCEAARADDVDDEAGKGGIGGPPAL